MRCPTGNKTFSNTFELIAERKYVWSFTSSNALRRFAVSFPDSSMDHPTCA